MNRLIDNIKVEVCNGNHLASRNPQTTPVGKPNIEGQPLVMEKKTLLFEAWIEGAFANSVVAHIISTALIS